MNGWCDLISFIVYAIGGVIWRKWIQQLPRNDNFPWGSFFLYILKGSSYPNFCFCSAYAFPYASLIEKWSPIPQIFVGYNAKVNICQIIVSMVFRLHIRKNIFQNVLVIRKNILLHEDPEVHSDINVVVYLFCFIAGNFFRDRRPLFYQCGSGK